MPQTWLIVGASRGIGLEFVTQLLAQGHKVIATTRGSAVFPPSPENQGHLWTLIDTPNGKKNLTILHCDVSDEVSIKSFAGNFGLLSDAGVFLEEGVVDCVVLNAGILEYPNRISEVSFSAFAHHLHTNTIGPIITAQSLLSLPIQIKTLVFISSDSGSTADFRSFEDGFGAYGASKAALNQALRHLAAELQRKYIFGSGGKPPVVLALHPGEVSTDMAANVALGWEVEGVITPEESIRCMLTVISEKGSGGRNEGGKLTAKEEGKDYEVGAATFWTWEGVRYPW